MDIIGKKFGKWTALEFVGRDDKSNKIYKCKCDCGTEKEQRKHTLVSGESIQCKTCRMNDFNKVEELVGKKFGSWSVIGKNKNQQRNEWFYDCVCDCGTKRLIPGHSLKSEWTTQCHICRNKTHGMCYTSTFKIWAGMLARCTNSKLACYKYYGGRGITVCDRWLKFENFLEDMGLRPPKLQIDRIDNDGNYEPGNCRWVTAAVNHSNRNINRFKKEK